MFERRLIRLSIEREDVSFLNLLIVSRNVVSLSKCDDGVSDDGVSCGCCYYCSSTRERERERERERKKHTEKVMLSARFEGVEILVCLDILL